MSLKQAKTIRIIIALFFQKNHNIPLISTEAQMFSVYQKRKNINETAKFLSFDKRTLILIFCTLDSSASMVSYLLKKYKTSKFSSQIKNGEKLNVSRVIPLELGGPHPSLCSLSNPLQPCQTERGTREMNLKPRVFQNSGGREHLQNSQNLSRKSESKGRWHQQVSGIPLGSQACIQSGPHTGENGEMKEISVLPSPLGLHPNKLRAVG